MSKSVFIGYRGHGFWAFDVVSSILLKYLVDASAAHIAAHSPWLGEVVHQWRVQILVTDFGFALDETWSDGQVEVISGLVETVCKQLEKREEIPAEEIEGWQILDGNRIFARGISAIGTKSVASLGRAIISLLKGSIPEPPAGKRWWYGIDAQPDTIPSRQ
jgi:hypothetical protein